jgi:hypothetical protein
MPLIPIFLTQGIPLRAIVVIGYILQSAASVNALQRAGGCA